MCAGRWDSDSFSHLSNQDVVLYVLWLTEHLNIVFTVRKSSSLFILSSPLRIFHISLSDSPGQSSIHYAIHESNDSPSSIVPSNVPGNNPLSPSSPVSSHKSDNSQQGASTSLENNLKPGIITLFQVCWLRFKHPLRKITELLTFVTYCHTVSWDMSVKDFTGIRQKKEWF